MPLDLDLARELGGSGRLRQSQRRRLAVRSGLVGLVWGVVLAGLSLGLAGPPDPPPVAVAPGDASSATPASGCPSFHWGRAEAALYYELVVYAAEGGTADGAPLEPALSERIHGTASGWSPALDRCLEAGAIYAWSVRAISEDGPTAWAAPLFFRVPAQPSTEARLNALSRDERSPREAIASELAAASPVSPEPVESSTRVDAGGSVGVPPPAEYSGGGFAALRVAGEVRTVDAGGEPRLWGEGRPGARIWGPDDETGAFCSNGSIQFGLSHVAVDWGSAPAACPEGTWVCSAADLTGAAGCDTARPDSNFDGVACTGSDSDFGSSSHFGWLADSETPVHATALFEHPDTWVTIAVTTCFSLPVWCCFPLGGPP